MFSFHLCAQSLLTQSRQTCLVHLAGSCREDAVKSAVYSGTRSASSLTQTWLAEKQGNNLALIGQSSAVLCIYSPTQDTKKHANNLLKREKHSITSVSSVYNSFQSKSVQLKINNLENYIKYLTWQFNSFFYCCGKILWYDTGLAEFLAVTQGFLQNILVVNSEGITELRLFYRSKLRWRISWLAGSTRSLCLQLNTGYFLPQSMLVHEIIPSEWYLLKVIS